MPIYEYQCSSCNVRSEVTRGIKEEEVVPRCSTCDDHPKMVRVITTTSFILKGKGWAKDGYS